MFQKNIWCQLETILSGEEIGLTLIKIYCTGFKMIKETFEILYASCAYSVDKIWNFGAPPGVLGIWGERLFIFRELGSTANYFRGAGEQAHTFGDLGSTAKK